MCLYKTLFMYYYKGVSIMWNKEELEKLLKEQNYIEISNIFEREYRECERC